MIKIAILDSPLLNLGLTKDCNYILDLQFIIQIYISRVANLAQWKISIMKQKKQYPYQKNSIIRHGPPRPGGGVRTAAGFHDPPGPGGLVLKELRPNYFSLNSKLFYL